MLAVTDTRDNSEAVLAKYSSRVNAAIDYFGPLDLTDLGIPLNNDIVKNFLGGKTKEEAPEVYKEASPINHVTKDAAPLLILHSKGDTIPFWHAQKMAEAYKQAGAEVTLLSPPGGHGFHWQRDQEGAKQAWQAVLEFLQRRFPDAPSATGGKAGATSKPDWPGQFIR